MWVTDRDAATSTSWGIDTTSRKLDMDHFLSSTTTGYTGEAQGVNSQRKRQIHPHEYLCIFL